MDPVKEELSGLDGCSSLHGAREPERLLWPSMGGLGGVAFRWLQHDGRVHEPSAGVNADLERLLDDTEDDGPPFVPYPPPMAVDKVFTCTAVTLLHNQRERDRRRV